MPRPEPFAHAPRYPITALIAASAIVVTAALHIAPDRVEPLYISPAAFTSQPWRLVTSALPHIGVFHLIFNLYWTWTLGVLLERTWGHGRYLAFVLGAAAFSAAAEWALDSGGVGLSGVGYALFGVLWALRRHPAYAGMMDKPTATLFTVWLFVCIAATYLGLMRVGNVAHAAGAGFGLLVGAAIASHGPRRALWATVLLGLTALTYAGATLFRPNINLANIGLADASTSIEFATKAIHENRHEDAARHMRAALRQYPDNAQWWSVLASQLDAAGDLPGARDAIGRAVALDPDDHEIAAMKRHLEHGDEMRRLVKEATTAITEKRHADAARALKRAVELDPENASWWASLAVESYYAGDIETARDAVERSVRLNPSDKEMAKFLQQLRTRERPGN